MKYVVLFPECQNVHLIKRVGMVPFFLYQLYGWDSVVACYKNDIEYPYLDKEVKGLKMEELKKFFHNPRLDGILYLIQNAKEIDVLQIFHIHTTRNYYWIWIYKSLNPRGKVYLMLDTNYGLVGYNPFGKGVLKKIRKSILAKCTLVSAETESTAYGLTDDWGIKIECINNGFAYSGKRKVSYDEKENIICTVGRIGTFQKNTEVLLQAYKLFEKKHPEWKLRIIGSVEEAFYKYIAEFLYKNPNLRNKIVFTGEISDRNLLFDEYRRAKIFCMTSRWEGFAVSYMEALSAGCFIVTSSVHCAFDVTDFERYGRIFAIGDYIGLYKCLLRVCEDETLFKINCKEALDFVMENYDWKKSSMKIHDFLMEK